MEKVSKTTNNAKYGLKSRIFITAGQRPVGKLRKPFFALWQKKCTFAN